jgi:hypothetical protein
VLTAALACAMVSGCAAPTVLVTAPAERALRPRRVFVLLALGPEVTPRHLAATTRAWRALGDELQVRGFDFVALAAPPPRGANAGPEELTASLEHALGDVDLARYDELVLVTSPAGTCAWSLLTQRGGRGEDVVPSRLSLHVELAPAWAGRRSRGQPTADVAAPTCPAPRPTSGPSTRRLVIRLEGRSASTDVPLAGSAAAAGDAARTLDGTLDGTFDVPLDARAFGRDFVLLIDEIFAARASSAAPSLDLRRITR